MKTHGRTQRFSAGQRVSLCGRIGFVKEAHCDPHPPQFSHCSGNSARYVVTFSEGDQTCWDWQLSAAPKADAVWCSPSLLTEDDTPSLDEALGIVNDFKRRFPNVSKFFFRCTKPFTCSASTTKAATPAA